MHEVSKGFQLSADWVFGTGQAITLPTEVYIDNNGSEVEVYEGRNDFRMGNFHHLDVAMKFTRQKRKHERSWVISVYNVYNRQNPFFIYRDYDYINDKPVFKQVSFFPIIPSFSYQFRF